MKIFLFLALAHAAGTSLVQDAPPSKVLRNEAVTFKAKPGYHFNQKAPQRCGEKSAEDLTKESLVCQFTSGGTQKVSLKICDEKETFCKNEDFTVEVPGPATAQGASQASTRPLLEGFTTDTEKALTEAKASKRILFIDFGAAWCPPCNSMEETITSTKTFRDASRDFVRVYQDIDLSTSYPWQSKFGVSSYPTYVVTDADMNEIGRFTNTAPPAVFLKWLRGQESLKDRPLNKIDPKTATPEERVRLGGAFFDQHKYAQALEVVNGVDSRKAQYVAAKAKVELAKDDPAKLKELLPDVIAKFDDQSAVVDWTGEWLKVAPDKSKVIATIPKMIEKLKASGDVRDEGVTDADIYVGFADYLEPVDKKMSAKYFGLAADSYAQAIKDGGEKNPRGFNMERIYCLYHAGRGREAFALAKKLNKIYPKDYVFNRSLARMYLKDKKYAQALEQVNQAEKKAYGDMYFHVVELKGEILMGMGKKAEAHKLAETAIARLDLPENRKLGPHYAMASLKKLLKDSAN